MGLDKNKNQKDGVKKLTEFLGNKKDAPFKVAGVDHEVLKTELPLDDKNSPACVAPKYMKNRVTQYRCGHFVEFDETEGNERIRVGHKSGAYVQMNTDGSIQVRTKSNSPGGDGYVAIDNNLNMKIGGNFNVHVAKGELRFKVESKAFVESADLKIKTNGNVEWDVSGDVKWTVTGNYTLKATRIDFNP